MKPIVGLMPLWDDEKNRLWMRPDYLDCVMRAGGIPFVFPFAEDTDAIRRLASLCDGFLFTGGQDVSPSLYGEKVLNDLVHCCEKRDALEKEVLMEALKQNKPVLGICRGIQLLNAALGGTLYQDLPSQRPSDIAHNKEKPYDRPVHTVSILQGTPLDECIGTQSLSVNSCHHQAVKDPAPGLEIMACSPDGIAEALYMPGHPFFWGVQWHPEMLGYEDPGSRKIFDAFIGALKQENNGFNE